MTKSKAENWATRSAKDRAKLYLGMRAHLREVASLLDDECPGEAQSLLLTARSFGGVAAQVHKRIEMDKRPSCCFSAKMFGSCKCEPTT